MIERVRTDYEQFLLENKVQINDKGLRKGFEWLGMPLKEQIELSLTSVKPPRNMRDECISRFLFAIPTLHAIKELTKHGPFLEVGCGTGYWAYEIMKSGGHVIPVDPKPLSDVRLQATHQHVPIDRVTGTEALKKYGAKGLTLFMCWPSLNVRWVSDTLAMYLDMGGQKVAYIGEGHGGCTGDDRFHEILEEYFEEIEEIPILKWYMIHDHLTVHKRKEGSDAQTSET